MLHCCYFFPTEDQAQLFAHLHTDGSGTFPLSAFLRCGKQGHTPVWNTERNREEDEARQAELTWRRNPHTRGEFELRKVIQGSLYIVATTDDI
jgi:hypothetical protein